MSMFNKSERSAVNQVKLGLLAHFSSIGPSMTLGFSAVAVEVLRESLNSQEISWFASIAPLASPFGCILAGVTSDRFGRTYAISCVNVTCFLGWLLIAAAYYVNPTWQYGILLLGRIFTGLSAGFSSIPATVYMAEVSSPSLRSIFTTWASVFFALGVLVVYALGLQFKRNWGAIAAISALFPCIGFVFTHFLMPESPSWLVAKNRYDEARENMCHIFGTKIYNQSVESEIESLIRNKGVKDHTQTKTFAEQARQKLKHLLKPNCLKPFLLVMTYFLFQQISGVFVIIFYAIDIVRAAGITMDAHITIVVIGIVRLLTAIAASFCSKNFGRRTLSIYSGIGMTICMLGLSAYIWLIHRGTVNSTLQDYLSFVPIVCLLAYFVTSTFGFLPMPFALSAEVFPRKVRGTASSLNNCSNYFFNFLIVNLYPTMVERLGREGVFFFYGCMSLIGTVFVIIFLPETKGKSLQEIEEYFKSKNEKQCRTLVVNDDSFETVNAGRKNLKESSDAL